MIINERDVDEIFEETEKQIGLLSERISTK